MVVFKDFIMPLYSTYCSVPNCEIDMIL